MAVETKLRKSDKRAIITDAMPPDIDNQEFLIGGGETGELMRSRDWSDSALGPPPYWSPALKATVSMMLTANVQIVLFWGESYVALYNDDYAPTIGDKHPAALGMPASEHWSEQWDDLKPLLDKVRISGQTVSAKDRPFCIERHGYPETVYFDISYSPVRGAGGTIEGVICIVNETTDRVLAEDRRELAAEAQAVTASALARQAAFFKTALDAIVTIDDKGVITEFNPAAERIFGWKRREVLGLDLADVIIPKKLRSAHRHGFQRYLKTGKGAYIDKAVEVTAVRRTGEEFPVELTITQIKGSGSQEFMGTVRDISDRKAAEEKLKQSEAQQEFLLGLADSLRSLNDTKEIKDEAARQLGEYLGVNRVYYVEVEPDGRHVTVEDNYVKDAPSLAGRYNLYDFGSRIEAEYESTRMVVINDALSDKRIPKPLRIVWKMRKIGAMAGIPLVRDGQLVAALGMDKIEAHDWSEDEVAMLDAVAERIWTAVERTRTETALKESERRFRFVVQNASDIITVVDKKGHITYQSPSITRVLGWPPKNRPDINIFDSDLVHPDDKKDKNKFIKQLIAADSGSQQQREFRMRDTSGEWHYMDVVGINLLHLKGIEGVILSSRDATERRKNRQHLKESRERLELAEYASGMGSFEWNLMDGRILWSKAQEQLHGLAAGSFGGELDEWRSLIHPGDFDRVLAQMMKSIEEKTNFEAEWRIVRPDGEERIVEARAQLFFDKAGQPTRIVGTNIDITDRKHYERQKDEFIAIASHELKTPVTSMKMYTAALARRFKRAGDEASAEAVGEIDNQLNRLNTLIRDLLDVTNIEAGHLRLRRTEFNYDELLKQTIGAVQITTDRHHISVTGASKCRITSDRERLAQVLTNLLVNAIKYSPKSPEIVVSVKRDKNNLVTCVADHGIGIPKSQQSGLFERFSRVGGTSTDNYPGLGLGLFISAQIINRLGGQIWVESKFRHGSKFYFNLPLDEKQGRMSLR